MLSLARFEEEIREYDIVFALVDKEVIGEVGLLEVATLIVEEFRDLFPKD